MRALPSTRVTLLLVLSHPGFLRLYDEVLEELLERGHRVHVAFEHPETSAETMPVVERLGSVVLTGRAPARDDVFAGFAQVLRRTADYAIYLHPRLARARVARERRERRMPALLPRLVGGRSLSPGAVRLLLRAFLSLERAVPTSSAAQEFVRSSGADALVVASLVNDSGRQTDAIKAAQSLGLPTGVSVASWDNLTTKGLMRVHPDSALVWNEAQAEELRELHAFPVERVVVTGAQPFDRWFGRPPTLDREAFCAPLGLDPDVPFVVYTASSRSIAPADREAPFILEWIRALRDSLDPVLRAAGVLVRPHPLSLEPWQKLDLDHLGVKVWPTEMGNLAADDSRAGLFDSLHHGAAVVGLNTSAMLEAAIIGRPVHTIRVPEFVDGQDHTPHFRHLLPENGGFLRVAGSLAEHVRQLSESVADPAVARPGNERFVKSFIRPRGPERPCTPMVVDAIEALADAIPEPPPSPTWAPLLRAIVTAFYGWRLGAGRVRRKAARRRARRSVRRTRRFGRRLRGVLRTYHASLRGR